MRALLTALALLAAPVAADVNTNPADTCGQVDVARTKLIQVGERLLVRFQHKYHEVEVWVNIDSGANTILFIEEATGTACMVYFGTATTVNTTTLKAMEKFYDADTSY